MYIIIHKKNKNCIHLNLNHPLHENSFSVTESVLQKYNTLHSVILYNNVVY